MSPRVTFVDYGASSRDGVNNETTDENTPLLSSLPRLGDGGGLTSSHGSPKSILTDQRHQHGSTITSSSKNGGDYLPLHANAYVSRTRSAFAPSCRTLGYAVGGLVIVIFIVTTSLRIDKVHHPTGPFPSPPPRPGQPGATRNPAYLIEARNGAVASENGVCSEVGVDVLKDGGNAVDAAIASTFCIGVLNLFSSNIGGGGFMTVRLPPSTPGAESEVWTIDFRETAPALANTTMYVDNPESSMFGGLSVGVPGEVRGLAEAHKRWGYLPWNRLVQPSVDLASGWNVTKELGIRLEWFKDMIFGDPVWTEIFAPNGRLLKEGELARRTNYSRTLATIAEEGPNAFYKGPIADAIVSAVQSTGGIMTHEDLENYNVEVYRSLKGTYRGRKVYTPHAPTSGPVLLHMLNLLEKYDLVGEGRTGLNTHRLVEVVKFGFAARTRICDPAFVKDEDVRLSIAEIATKAYGARVSANVTDSSTHKVVYYNPVFDVPEDHGTSHVSVVDKNDMAVAITSTVNLIFGSRLLDRTTGILLNDEMDDFSTPGVPNAFGLWPSPYNYPEPGKRPLSSTVPTIVENADGSFYLAVGGSGGSKIFPAVMQVILGVDDWGMDVSSAIEAGRVHDQLYPTYVEVDSVIPEDVVDMLRSKGHNVTVMDIGRVAAVVQAVMRKGDMIYAASDSRKNGIAAGY